MCQRGLPYCKWVYFRGVRRHGKELERRFRTQLAGQMPAAAVFGNAERNFRRDHGRCSKHSNIGEAK